MVIFLVYLITTSHGVLCGDPGGELNLQIQGPTWETVLWCDLPGGHVDDRDGEGCEPAVSGESNHNTTQVGQCHTTSSSSLPLSTKESHGDGVLWLNVLCWINVKAENLICNLKHHFERRNKSRLSLHLEILHSGSGDGDNVTAGGVPNPCEGKDDITCPVALHTTSDPLTLIVGVSSCFITARSPAMYIIPETLLQLDPPVNLQYNMTLEGRVRLSWATHQPDGALLHCDVRSSSKGSAQAVVSVRGVRRPEVDLGGLSPGLNYSIQVRCKALDKFDIWSDWSRPLYIYLHEVSYLPERLFASTGSNVTIRCIFNNQSLNASSVVWWLNYHEKVPESQYRVISDHVSSVTLLNVKPLRQRGYDVLHCCQRRGEKSLCSYPYAQIYITDFNIAISCETNGDLTYMTCRWNASQWAEVQFLYRRYNLPCDLVEEEVGVAVTEECPVEGRGSNRCTLKPLLLASCYLMWLEVRKEEGTLKSHPVYMTPMELVKPHPPFDLEAVTVPDGALSLRWKRHGLPVYDFQYEVRYAVNNTGTQWKVVGSIFNESAVVPVSHPCAIHAVQVRCKRSIGPGYWSDWSSPTNTTVRNYKAPEEGPEYWRLLQEYPEWNQTNVTLLLKPSQGEKQLYCVERLEVHHETTGGAVWSEYIGHVSSYAFLWSEEVHSVTVVAFNNLGSSTRNRRMTLSRRTKPQAVKSFRSVMINSSCVALSWTLLPNTSGPMSFVIEWRSKGQRDAAERVDWVRLPPETRAFHLHGAFFASEEYQFILFPIYANGEGEPVSSKDDRGHPGGEQAAYTLLMIIAFLSVVLFVTLTVSQHQMKKLVWKDVPNPNNCSWAQGVDFKKVEAIENLFRHPEWLTSQPLLLESEIISEAMIVENTASPAKEIGSIGTSPCKGCEEPLGPKTPTFSRSSEGSAQSRITYATVLLPEEPNILYKQQGSLSSSSDEGNFSANVSDISGSIPGGMWELENCPRCESSLRHSCSYNSAEEFSEASEQEDEAPRRADTQKSLCYLRMTSQEEGGEDQGNEEGEDDGIAVRFVREGTPGPPSGQCPELPLESSPLLGPQGSGWSGTEAAVEDVPLYMPQFRTAPHRLDSSKAYEWSLQRSPDL
ncbi:leptin receptor isoform X2 [Scleropages formosus]|uniref:Leptin receptor n=1 Tax=Scleropages formosus TaxID=113540 RepID=A0A8C9R0A9_SCLFO|nr:leptin receptor isoform X2 [Scleropages formosus]